MSHEPRLDPILDRLLAEAPTLRAPDQLRIDITSATRRTRQRPPWLISLKEPPMRHRSQLVAGSPALRVAAVLAATVALTLAIGGAVIAGASPSPGPAVLPSPDPSPTAPVAPTWVTGSTAPVEGTCSQLDIASDEGAVRYRYACDETWTSTDPRLSGDVSRPWNEDVYRVDEGSYSVSIDAPYLRNEGGGWACIAEYLAKGSTPNQESLGAETFTCTGNGGYEGLSAVLVSTWIPDSFANEFVGLIFSGDLPPVPEPPAAQ